MSAPPIPYTRQASFTQFATEQFPTTGQGLEAEFNKVAQSIDTTQARLAEIQRDDGKLRNMSVHIDALDRQVMDLMGGATGYLPPVPFAAGLNVNTHRFTVLRTDPISGETYAYAPAVDVPFTTTETFDPGQWRLVQGVSGTDLAASSGAEMVGRQTPGGVMRTVGASLADRYHANDWGLTGDDAPEALQEFLDECEAHGRVAEFDGAKTYKVKQNLYLGNLRVQTNGALFEILSDENFHAAGTAFRRNEGVILTKSAGGAGFGYSSVSLSFDVFRYTFSRPTQDVGPRTAVLLENVNGMTCPLIDCRAATGQDSVKCLLDFYGGCRNINIGVIKYFARNGTRAGGMWIRNAFSTPSENIEIGVIEIDHQGFDEALSIYAFTFGDSVVPIMRNVHIGTIKGVCDYGNGISIIDISGKPYAPERFSNIVIDRVEMVWTPGASSRFGIKCEAVPASFGTVNISIPSVTGASGNTFAIRYVRPSGRNEKMHIGVANVALGDKLATGNMYGVYGQGLDIRDLTTSTYSNGEFTEIVSYRATVHGGVIRGASSSYEVSNAEYIGNAAHVYGRMQGVSTFYGTQYVDTDKRNNAYWFLHSSGTLKPDVGVVFDGVQIVTGSGTIQSLFRANATLSSTKTVDIKSRIINLSDKTLPDDTIGGSFVLTSYDSVQVKSSGAERRSKTPDV